MASQPDPGELTHLSSPPPPSFDDFQRQTSLMTSCTLLWKELSDHFSSLEQDLIRKSDSLKAKFQVLNSESQESLQVLNTRESSISKSMSIVWSGLLMKLKSYCRKMEVEFWIFVTSRKKELEMFRSELPKALANCIDSPRFVLEAISEVFPLASNGSACNNYDLGWACVLLLESLIPVMMDPVLGNDRMLVTPTIKVKAEEIAELEDYLTKKWSEICIHFVSYDRPRNSGYQIAHGVMAKVDLEKMVLMDWQDSHLINEPNL